MHGISMQNRIRHLRVAAALSQSALAERLGTSINMLGKLERGERQLNASWIQRISEALGTAPTNLFVGQEDVLLVGEIHHAAIVHINVDNFVGLKKSDLPREERPPLLYGDQAALKVVGDGMAPYAEDGWIVFFEIQRELKIEPWLGSLCLVSIAENPAFAIRRVMPGSTPETCDLVWGGGSYISKDIKPGFIHPITAIVVRRTNMPI